MGSLILLLLVIDRRAKYVALAKARAALAREDEELARAARVSQDAVAARAVEWQRRRDALHKVLVSDDDAVRDRLKAIQVQMQSTTEKIEGQRAEIQDIKSRLGAGQGRLARTRQDLDSRRAELESANTKSEGSKKDLARLTADLVSLERTLADLKAAREREKQTYSLVPYLGKRGDNRRPLYVECTRTGIVFHPDKFTVNDVSSSGVAVRSEVERRVAAQKLTLAAARAELDHTPYLLLLVRPDGVMSYYQTLSALTGIAVDFGYEFVEADWAFDFSDRDDAPAKPQPWMTVAKPDYSRPATPGPRPTSAGGGSYASLGSRNGPELRAKSLGPSSIGTGRLGNSFGNVGTPGNSAGLPGVRVPGAGPGGTPGAVPTVLGTGSPGQPTGFNQGNLTPRAGPGGVGARGGYPGAVGAPGGTAVDEPRGLPGVGNVSNQTTGPNSGGQPGLFGTGVSAGVQEARGDGRGLFPRSGPGVSSSAARPTVQTAWTGGGTPGGSFAVAGNGTGPGTGSVGPNGGGSGVQDGSGGERAPVQPWSESSQGSGAERGLGSGGTAGGSPFGSTANGAGLGSPQTIANGGGSAGSGIAGGANGGAGNGVGRAGGQAGSATTNVDGSLPSAPGTPSAPSGPGGQNNSNSGVSPNSGPPSSSGSVGSLGGTGPATSDSAPATSASGPPPVFMPPIGGRGSSPGSATSPASSASATSTGSTPAVSSIPGGRPSGAPADDDGPRVGLTQHPLTSAPKERTETPAPPRPQPRFFVNRDWPIIIECKAEGAVLINAKLTVSNTALSTGGANQLSQAIQTMIARRQSTVRADEPPYRPRLRFRVWPDGLRAFHLAYPALESLKLPMSHENVDADADAKP
jgi:hypothetical protein